MDEDATWYGSRRRPGHIVLDGDLGLPILATADLLYKHGVRQELISRLDSERELLRSAPGSYPNSLK